ncbi:MAG: Cu(I)-responsive transcriptional regulator [Noviherbaspirillum sp.]
MNIGEAASASGVTAKMIRYYEGRGLIPGAARKDSGYRQFNERDVQTLRFIRRARDLGFSLDRIGTLLALWGDQGRRSSDVRALARQYMGELDRDIANLQAIREQLAQLEEHCHGDSRPDCPILDGLAQPAGASAAA